MAKSNQEIILTPSGHQVDKDLARVPVKVSPALQALIVNQMELIEMIEGKIPQNPVFVEQHKLEMLQVEEEIAGAFASYMQKKELAKERRQQKRKARSEGELNGGRPAMDFAEEAALATAPGLAAAHSPGMAPQNPGESMALSPANDLPWDDFTTSDPLENHRSANHNHISNVERDGYNGAGPESTLQNPGPGLPSAKYADRTQPAAKKVEIDVRRVAIGASIKALQDFLGRQLSEEEISSIEAQVDSYLG